LHQRGTGIAGGWLKKFWLRGTPSTILDRCAPLDDVGDRGVPIV